MRGLHLIALALVIAFALTQTTYTQTTSTTAHPTEPSPSTSPIAHSTTLVPQPAHESTIPIVTLPPHVPTFAPLSVTLTCTPNSGTVTQTTFSLSFIFSGSFTAKTIVSYGYHRDGINSPWIF